MGNNMINDPERARADLPKLRFWLDRLLAVSREAFSPSPPISSDDDLGFMALSFAYKQNVHGQSVLTLGDGIDAILIVRSMLEGLAQLLWAFKEPHERPQLWRTYAYVLDWRRVKEAEKAGTPIDQDDREQVMSGIQEHGPRFYGDKARAAVRERRPLPADPYRKTWSGRPIDQIFAEVKASLHYSLVYGPFSEWHHWSPGGFGRAVKETEEGYRFSTVSPLLTAAALSGAFLCLWKTMEVTDQHLSLGHSKQLLEVQQGYMADIGPKGSSEAPPGP